MDAGHERQREPERETTAETPPLWRGRGRGLLIGGATVFGLLFLTLISVALVLVAGPGDGRGGEGRAEAPETFQEKYISGKGAAKIAVLPVVGQIGPKDSSSLGMTVATPETLRDQLRQAAKDRQVKAIVLEINSPGGGVVASDQMHKSIQDFKETTKKPVIVSMGETTASGGYYISTAADKIVANENTLTGSLGVIFSYLNYKDAADKLGLEEEVIKSGKYKDIGSPFRKPTEKELEILQTLIDESYDKFVDVIVEGRNLPKDRVRELADGRVYSGLQAKSLGLADELGGLEKAAELSRELGGLEEATVVRYERAPGLLGLLRARLAPPEPETLKALKAAGISLNPELQYLYRP